MARRWDSSYGKLQDPLPKDTYNVTDEEKAYWNRKQERLVYDPVPTEGSINTVTSGAVHAAIKDSAEQTAKEYKKYFNSSQVGLQALSDAIAESVTKLQEVQEEVERKRREVVQKGELVDQRTYAALSYQNGAADCAAAAEASASETATSAANAKASAQTATEKASEAATSAANAKASEDKAKAYMEEAKTDVSDLATEVDEIDNGLNSLFRYYEGVDLTQKFASEIANYSDEWAWIKARIQASNFKGIYVCDYIPITCSNGYVLNAQVAGINTYKGYGDNDNVVGNHIDFICKEVWNDVHVMNKVKYNNGNANSPSPFLASDLNYWLNSMSGNVPNSTSDPSVTTEVDYTTSGVLYYLPDKLKNQIITKRILLPSRYTEGKVLTNNNSWVWQSTGKLWMPSEVEVCGTFCWENSGYGMGGFVQYPIFANNMNRAKLRCAIKDRCGWWLLSAGTGNSANFALVNAFGNCDTYSATTTWVASSVCFRIG